MDPTQREQVIAEYYAAVDDREPERFRDIFTRDATHFRPGQGTLEGIDAIIDFFTEDWRSSETSHDREYVLHDADRSVARLHVSGIFDGEPFEGRFLAEFEFEDDAIATYHLYRGYER
ncbi:MAG: nuclear transport factor 2 family protein [Salinirussus sp.]